MYIYNFNDNMNGIPMVNVEMVTPAQVAVVSSSSSSSLAATSTNTSNLSVGTINTTGATPLTPEILNSVMAMTNPLEYTFPSTNAGSLMTTKISQSSDSHSSSSGSPFDSPLATTPSGSGPIVKEATTPTVQQTCSQLIKTSLKLSLEMKRKMSTSDSSSVDTSICKKIKPDLDTSDDEDEMIMKPSRSSVCLSPEDEDRRRRRRERNKIAATKCRMKKRERTTNLVGEAETLEAQNIDLKAQMRSLEIERRSLTEMLQLHASSCALSDGVQIPNVNAAITKYLMEMGLGNGQQSTSSPSETLITVKTEPVAKVTRHTTKSGQQRQQKIPSVNTLKFGTRRGAQQANKLHQSSTVLSPATGVATMPIVTSPAAAAVVATIPAARNCLIGVISTASPIQECKPLPSIDMGFCESGNESLTPTSSYCKSLMSTSSDCYAISSPDSGFIKSPVDMGNFATLPQIMKSDYIPNCDTGMLNDSSVPGNVSVASQDNSMEFILKSELVDANESPYTTVQSADRFLFDGVAEAFDPDMDGTAPNPNHISLIEAAAATHMHDGLKEQLMLHGLNNNNNNSTHINNNHHQHAHPHHQQQQHHHHHQHGGNGNLDASAMMHDFGGINNLPVISSVLTPPSVQPPHSTSIIEFNTACQPYIDASLLKGDFLSQNCDFLDSQFTTDLDSGVTTYTNSSGCLA